LESAANPIAQKPSARMQVESAFIGAARYRRAGASQGAGL
jgi:hypothetical protein